MQKIQNDRAVRYSNHIFNLNLGILSSKQMDVFMYICALLGESKTPSICIPYCELKKASSFSKNATSVFHSFLKELQHVLSTYTVGTISKSEDPSALFSIFSFQEKELLLEASPTFYKTLSQIEQYTTFDFAEFLSIRSRYAKLVYTLCKRWRMKGTTQWYTIEDLKIFMHCPDSFENKKFLSRCIMDSISYLQGEFVNLRVEKEISGRHVKRIRFLFSPEATSTQGFAEIARREKITAMRQKEKEPSRYDISKAYAKEIQKVKRIKNRVETIITTTLSTGNIDKATRASLMLESVRHYEAWLHGRITVESPMTMSLISDAKVYFGDEWPKFC